MADKRQAIQWLLDGHKIRNDKLKHDMFFYLDDNGEIRDEHNELCEFNSLWFEGYHIYNPEPEYDPKEVQLNSDPLIHDQDYVVWDKAGWRTIAYWDAYSKSFFPFYPHSAFALDVYKWKKLPEMPE